MYLLRRYLICYSAVSVRASDREEPLNSQVLIVLEVVLLRKIIDFVRFHVKRAFRSALVGAEGAVVQLVITYSLTEFAGVWYIYSAGLGILAAFAHNYLLNYYWAFRDVIKR